MNAVALKPRARYGNWWGSWKAQPLVNGRRLLGFVIQDVRPCAPRTAVVALRHPHRSGQRRRAVVLAPPHVPHGAVGADGEQVDPVG